MSGNAAPMLLIGFAVIGVSLTLLCGLVRLSGARLELRRLRRLHRNEAGAVQSLSFVLTLPIFILIMMGIVQASQLMIAQIVVEYAAIAAARSASVWIPAHMEGNASALDPSGGSGPSEGRNRIGLFQWVKDVDEGSIYEVTYGSQKVLRIKMAAVQACLPISPSRDSGHEIRQIGGGAYNALVKAYHALDPESENNSVIPQRLKNKLAYSIDNTFVQIHVFHPSAQFEPTLGQRYDDFDQHDPMYVVDYDVNNAPGQPTIITPLYHPLFEEDAVEYQQNEIGWQDEVTVTVNHRLALLPGPGRLFARIYGDESESSGSDSLADDGAIDNTENPSRIDKQGDTYTWLLTAQATVSNNGQKPILRYEYQATGMPQ